jgi:hypothetical protein
LPDLVGTLDIDFEWAHVKTILHASVDCL